MKQKSLLKSFVLVVLLVLLVGQSILGLWFLRNQRKQQAELLHGKVRTVSSLLSKFAATAILTYDYMNMDQFINAVSGDEDLLSLKVTDREGNVLRQKVFREAAGSEGESSFFLLPAVNKHTEGIVATGEKIGGIEVTYSGGAANANIKKVLLVTPLWQGAILAFVFLAIYFFFQRKIGRPINDLNRSLESITKGDLSVDIRPGANDEIGGIASGLDFLKQSLAETVGKLTGTASNVDMAIKQLNMTFRNVSESMKKQTGSLDGLAPDLKAATEAQQTITEGTEQLSDFSSENVTSLLEVKATADEIASSTGRLFQAVEDSYTALTQLSQSAKLIAENTQEGFSSVEETSASVEELSASVKEIDKSAKQSTVLADKVKELAAEEGVLIVADAIDSMEQISEKVQYTVDTVRKLGARSKDIEKMLFVIRDVTEQTNLLSLNAAILAAQAGEYGKGFSVVADEIRALSERTAASTKEIATIVKTIRGEIDEVVSSTTEAMKHVAKGLEDIHRAGSSTGHIVEAAQGASRMAQSIQKATEEQVKGLSQISLSVENIREIIRRMALSTEEQFKGSNYMLERMSEVKEVAEATRKGTLEQAAGTKHISENLELANDRVSEIKDFVRGQENLNTKIVGTVDRVRSIGTSTLNDVEELSFSLGTLHAEIEVLRKEMEKFRLNGKIHPV